MLRFLATQARNPFDPAPLLILADHLEESGDAIGAQVLRGLSASGVPSAMALAAADLPTDEFSCQYRELADERAGSGRGEGLGQDAGLGLGGPDGPEEFEARDAAYGDDEVGIDAAEAEG